MRKIICAAAISATLFLSGCAAQHTTPHIPLNSPANIKVTSEKQQQDFSAYYTQQITWENCSEKDGFAATTLDEVTANAASLRCATVAAPLDWTLTTSDKIKLRIAKVSRSTTENRPAIFFNPGGPGESALDIGTSIALSPEFAQVLAVYDFISFDPRGIGQSSPIQCFGDPQAATYVQLRKCARENPLVEHMGTSQVANDMDMLRVLTANQKLNYLGYSYGTMLGATYAHLFPEETGRMVLDSAENSEWATAAHQYEQFVAIDREKKQLHKYCNSAACPFNSDKELQTLYEKLDKNPLESTFDEIFDAAALDAYLIDALYYNPAGRNSALNQLQKALDGEQEAIDNVVETALSLSSAAADPTAEKPQNPAETELNLGLEIVTCHSSPRISKAQLRNYITASPERETLLGEPSVDDLVDSFFDISCRALKAHGSDYTGIFNAPTAEKILVIGVTGDHATPYKYATETVAELGNAQLLTLNGTGHAQLFTGVSSCLDLAATAYYLTGALPTTASCEMG